MSYQPAGSTRRIYKKDFHFDDAGLNDGIAILTPKVGDYLMDAWVSVTEAFSGGTFQARLDIGTFVDATQGLFYATAEALYLDVADSETFGTGLLNNAVGAHIWTAVVGNAIYEPSLASATAFQAVPALVTAANPIMFVISRDGAKGGEAINSTAGAGYVYLDILSGATVTEL